MFIVPFIEYGTKVFSHNVCFSKHVGNGTPSATTPVSPSTTGQTPSVVAIARRNIRKIKGKFSTLVTKSRTRLQSRETSVEDVQTFLITMYSSPNSRDGSYMVTTTVESAKSLDEIFRALSKYGLWDYLNYYLLQSIIEEFASDDNELNGMMEQYQRDLTGHILTLKIETHLDAVSENTADEKVPPPQQLFEKLSVKVEANVTNYSLKYVDDLWQSLANQFALPQPAMILHKVAEGCIGITWLIPANLVGYVTRMAQKTSNMFAEKHILRVMLEEKCIYLLETEPPLLETEHPLLETDPLLLETEPPLLETDPPLLETEPPLLETEPPLLEIDPPPLETDPPLLETKPPLLETEHPLLETDPPLLETEPPLLETEPPLLQTESPLLETEPPLLETEPPLLETKPPLLETEHPLLETEPPLPESEEVALKKKVCFTLS